MRAQVLPEFGDADEFTLEDVPTPTAAETSRRVIALLTPGPGETVVVNGAAGSVGSIAVQLLVRAGATVIGTAGAENQDYVRRLGAVPTTYGTASSTGSGLAPDGVDAVSDVTGYGFAGAVIALRGGTDRIVTIADFDATNQGIAVPPARQDRHHRAGSGLTRRGPDTHRRVPATAPFRIADRRSAHSHGGTT